MDTWPRRIAWIAGPIAVVIAGGLLGFDATRWQVSATGWLAGALALVGLVHHRTSRDPDALLLGIAGGVLLLQDVFSRIVVPHVGGGEADLDLLGSSLTAVVAGWALAAGCIVLVSPWWDRRGRPRIAASSFGLILLAIILVADILLLVAPLAPGNEINPFFGTVVPFTVLTWIWLVLGAIGWCFVAVRQCFLVRRGNQHGALAAGAIVATAFLLSFAAIASGATWAGEFAVGVSFWTPPISIGLLLLAASLIQRSDASRMRRETDRAEEIVEGRAEIASMVAHEVRGPVTTIRGIASTAATHYDGLDNAERREFFELIEQESRRLLAAVDQTSLALRIDARSLTYTMGLTDLAQAVRQGVEKAAVTSHPVHVVAEEGVELKGDRARIAQLVTQLVDNASKFSPAGSPITVRSVRDGDDALIEVDDRGPGIPVEQREVVFERFVRWRPKGYEEQPGNGLGLFISRGLAAEHQGEISVEDGPGGGTMLRVRLPVGGAARG
jgi:signal transduction histidine kinase